MSIKEIKKVLKPYKQKAFILEQSNGSVCLEDGDIYIPKKRIIAIAKAISAIPCQKCKDIKKDIKLGNELMDIRDNEISDLKSKCGELEDKLRITDEHEEAIMGDYQDEHKKNTKLKAEVERLEKLEGTVTAKGSNY